jgi:tetratricopeptide (TPR) repeat protein
MTALSEHRLDDQELLHLAIEASNESRHGDAIAYLKQAVERSAENYNALYLLAAQHAQIGMTDRAIEEFNRALALKPDLVPARFQLGLLFLCNGRVDEALGAWEALGTLPDSNPYARFAGALQCLARDDFPGSIEQIERGLAANSDNPALNRDMQGLLERIRAHMGSADASAPGQIFLSAYTKDLH